LAATYFWHLEPSLPCHPSFWNSFGISFTLSQTFANPLCKYFEVAEGLGRDLLAREVQSAILQSLPFPLPLSQLKLTPATAKRQIALGHKNRDARGAQE